MKQVEANSCLALHEAFLLFFLGGGVCSISLALKIFRPMIGRSEPWATFVRIERKVKIYTKVRLKDRVGLNFALGLVTL